MARPSCLGCRTSASGSSFCETVLQRPELATEERFAGNARRNANREALQAIIVAVFGALSATEVIARLEQARIANARANDMHEVWEHPQLKARDRWRQVDTPAGAVPALLPPGSWDQEGPRMDPVPALGAHTDAILTELGLGASDVAALRSAGAV